MLARAYFCLILSCILWSLNPVANKYALMELAVPQLVFLRTMCTALVMFVITLSLGYSFKFKKIGWRPFFLGIIDPGLTSLFFVSLAVLILALSLARSAAFSGEKILELPIHYRTRIYCTTQIRRFRDGSKLISYLIKSFYKFNSSKN